jgi:hypothetical protein
MKQKLLTPSRAGLAATLVAVAVAIAGCGGSNKPTSTHHSPPKAHKTKSSTPGY